MRQKKSLYNMKFRYQHARYGRNFNVNRIVARANSEGLNNFSIELLKCKFFGKIEGEKRGARTALLP